MLISFFSRKVAFSVTILLITVFCAHNLYAQKTDNAAVLRGRETYNQIKAFALTGGAADVSGLVLKRDRAVITFNGTFYFAAPVGGKVTGAVFIGQGTFRVEAPPSDFEKNNMKRLLGADVMESDFKTAVLRFTDDTFDLIAQNKRAGDAATANAPAQKLASESEPRLLKETGANISARLALSLLNAENPGLFFATFDGGKRERFSYVFDPQTRIPTAFFGINGGEKGLVFSYKSSIYSNEIWMAFFALEDYARGVVFYSDLNDLVDVTHYEMDADLREPRKKLGLRAKTSMQTRFPNLRAVTFTLGESLGEFEDQRLKKQMRLKSVRSGSEQLEAVQEDWEGGFTVFLPEAVASSAGGQQIDLEFELEGDFIQQPEGANASAEIALADCHYPRSNESWYPRHGYLDRATFDLTFRHSKKLKVATVGVRQSEQPDATEKDTVVTKYSMTHPVALVTFALGPFQRFSETIKWDDGSKPTPIEFNSLTSFPIKEDFILAELNNSVRYFYKLFGQYPYDSYGATFHPYAFGQGFPSMLLIPATDRANKYTYSFISHETAHQWWGNIVAWRSYRDQWLSEGFAEYSGVLYTALRKNPDAAGNLINEMRQSLKEPPQTISGPGKGRLVDVGPLILGHRLSTRKTADAYQVLIYNKGALVLRMIHFLMTDPATGDGQPFFNMMKDFVERHRNKVASTDDFRKVANEHFAKSPVAKRFQLTDMNWFFRQWVHQTELPAYRLEHKIENQPDGSVLLTGNVIQENVPEQWFMPLPIFITLGENKRGAIVVGALGPKTPFKIKLPAAPQKVELDPQKWVLSEKTTTN
ncbi:MAG TPA: M1 family aminopeptidase [Pyrinomonadaceae bacterium]|jgi:hypothetical protein